MVGTRGAAKKLLEHLESGKGLTGKEAFELYGVIRLSSHIYAFRKSGLHIVSIDHSGKTRYGTPCTYTEYRLIKNNKDE